MCLMMLLLLSMMLALPDDVMLDSDLPDDAMLDTALPLGAFLDAQIARVAARCDDTSETADTIEVETAILLARTSSPRSELPDMPGRYVMEGEIAEDFLVEQVLKAQDDLLNELNDNSVRVVTRGGRMTQEPLYPKGHPKRIVQDSQGVSTDAPSHPRKKKKDDRNLHASNPVAATPESPNDASVSDAETQSGDEHEPNDNINSDVHVDAQPSNDKDVEIEPVDLDNPHPKARSYDKNDFAARKHGKEREPWVQKPMPFPPKPSKKKDDEDFERFVEMIRPVFLQMRLTYMLKMSPYAKYMKDIVTNKRRIPEVETSTMLANYTFKGGTPKKLGDPGVPTIPCSIKGRCINGKIEHCHLYAHELSILKSAVTGDKSFNMGAIIARRLNNNANEGDYFGGIYATRIANFLGVPIREGDPPLHTAVLDRIALTRYEFLERDDESDLYRLIFNRQHVFHITLPAAAFFDF
ncbi:hypothetical protein ZWY2020_040372 [Hordeum vulgare]|nr:hypothetical protein ZWY2020_040372 [Hordeum vulgare]